MFAKISLNIAYHPMIQPIIPHLIPQLCPDDFYCHQLSNGDLQPTNQ
jgi:hypothetical protein